MGHAGEGSGDGSGGVGVVAEVDGFEDGLLVSTGCSLETRLERLKAA